MSQRFCNDCRRELDDSEFYPCRGAYCKRHQSARAKFSVARQRAGLSTPHPKKLGKLIQMESDDRADAIERSRLARAEEARIAAQLERDRENKVQAESFEPVLPVRLFGVRMPSKVRGWSCPMKGANSTS